MIWQESGTENANPCKQVVIGAALLVNCSWKGYMKYLFAQYLRSAGQMETLHIQVLQAMFMGLMV